MVGINVILVIIAEMDPDASPTWHVIAKSVPTEAMVAWFAPFTNSVRKAHHAIQPTHANVAFAATTVAGITQALVHLKGNNHHNSRCLLLVTMHMLQETLL
jgi:hypothetical protein